MKDFIRKYYLAIGYICFALVFISIIFQVFLAAKLELMAFDLRQTFRMKPAAQDIVIVGMDDTSITELSRILKFRYPFPRGVFARALENINQGNPAAIIFDLRVETQASEWDNQPEYADKRLFEAMKQSENFYSVHMLSFSLNDILKNKKEFIDNLNNKYGLTLEEYLKQRAKNLPLEYIKEKNFNKYIVDNTKENFSAQRNIVYYNIVPALPAVYQASKELGVINILKDEDNVARAIQPVFKLYDYYLMHISFAALHGLNENRSKITLNNNNMIFNGKKIPLDENMKYYPNWRKPVETIDKGFSRNVKIKYQQIPFYNVYFMDKNPLPYDIFKDKIVIITATTEIAKDHHLSPGKKLVYGGEIIATVVDNILNDDNFLAKAPLWLNILTVLFLIGLILIIYKYLSVYNPLLVYVFYTFIVVIFYVVINIIIFAKFSLWLNLVNPVFYATITSIFFISLRMLYEKDKRSTVENTFSKYVSPQVYNSLLSDYKNVDLKAYRADISVLFSDIRGFTSMSEDLSPEEVSRYLNECFEEMVEVIFQHNGTIDKFMGDAIMAFFGAPIADEDHAMNAVKAGLQMVEALHRLNDRWLVQGRRTLNIGIGINSGTALVGNFGSPKLMDYTVIGDTVNLASRLESLNKQEDSNLLISAFTYQQIKDRVNVRIVGPRKVKGKADDIIVYEVLGLKET
jgi:adenylate cyclase